MEKGSSNSFKKKEKRLERNREGKKRTLYVEEKTRFTIDGIYLLIAASIAAWPTADT